MISHCEIKFHNMKRELGAFSFRKGEIIVDRMRRFLYTFLRFLSLTGSVVCNLVL